MTESEPSGGDLAVERHLAECIEEEEARLARFLGKIGTTDTDKVA